MAETVVSKRRKKNITLGSGHIYIAAYTNSFPSTLDAVKTYCIEANRLGYIKGGASLEYKETTQEEKDDLGFVRKVITTDEEALLKLGIITWNGKSLQSLIDRCKVTEDADKKVRTTKIGGAGNAQGGYYVVIFHHEDKVDGDVWVVIVGRNTAGATLKFANDAGTQIEPEFKAIPHDEDGTLIEMYEEIGEAA